MRAVVVQIVRRILRIPALSREEILEIARAECARREWPWQEPVHVSVGLREADVVTNANSLGANYVIVVDPRDGRVVSAAVRAR